MVLTSAVKGQLTKAINANKDKSHGALMHAMTVVLARHMPKQQAKHAAKKLYAAAQATTQS